MTAKYVKNDKQNDLLDGEKEVQNVVHFADHSTANKFQRQYVSTIDLPDTSTHCLSFLLAHNYRETILL